jgi:hypothetical protein
MTDAVFYVLDTLPGAALVTLLLIGAVCWYERRR